MLRVRTHDLERNRPVPASKSVDHYVGTDFTFVSVMAETGDTMLEGLGEVRG